MDYGYFLEGEHMSVIGIYSLFHIIFNALFNTHCSFNLAMMNDKID
jgi:hypothetical protein